MFQVKQTMKKENNTAKLGICTLFLQLIAINATSIPRDKKHEPSETVCKHVDMCSNELIDGATRHGPLRGMVCKRASRPLRGV